MLCTSSCAPLVATRPRPLAPGPSLLSGHWPAQASRLAALVGGGGGDGGTQCCWVEVEVQVEVAVVVEGSADGSRW